MTAAAALTVAVCTRNRPAELSRCLASLRRLDPPAAALLVADQSDREPAREVRAACGADVRRLPVEPKGLGVSRQAALEVCGTECLAFTDDDCIVRPGWAGAIERVFARDAAIGAVTGPARPDPSMPLPPGVPEWVSDWGSEEEIRFTDPVDPSTIGGGLNMAFRVEAIRRVGGFDPLLGAGALLRSSEDADAFHRILRGGFAIVYTPEAVVSHQPPRDAEAQRRNEIEYAAGLAAWVERRREAGDPLPREYWRDALRRALSSMVRHAPADGPRRTLHRARVAWSLLAGRSRARRLLRAHAGEVS